METKETCRRDARNCDPTNGLSNGILTPRALPNVKEEPGKFLSTPHIKQEPVAEGKYAGNKCGLKTILHSSNIKAEGVKTSSQTNRSVKSEHSGEITPESKENFLSCCVKSEAFASESSSSSDSKLMHCRAFVNKLGNNCKSRNNVLRVIEEYFYLESNYLHFSESGDKFACTLCPIEYSSHGVMLSHLLGSKHMNTLWTRKQTSVSIMEKIEKLACLVPLLRRSDSTVSNAYNPSEIFTTAQRLDNLLHMVVKKGSPCCPTKLQHAWYLCDCLMDIAAEDGQLENYVPRRKVNLIKGEFLSGTDQKVECALAENRKVNMKIEF